MAFKESFVECMANAGIHVEPDAVTDEEHFDASVRYIKEWYDSLPTETKAGFEAISADEEFAILLAEDEVGVASYLPDLMRCFDGAHGWPMSTLLEWCEHCVDAAKQAGDDQGGYHSGQEAAQAGYGDQSR
jgi:hypothetical protein